jgi:hypothetical protein
MTLEGNITRKKEESLNNEDVVESKKSKFDILLINNGWNDKNEQLIASIGENSEVYKIMHEKSFKRYSLIHRIIGVIIVLMNSVLSAQIAFNGGNSCEQSGLFQKIVIYLVTIISVVNNFLNYQELATNHKNASTHFSEVTHDVQQQMCLYRKDRENAIKYIQHILKKYDSLNTSSPSVPDYLIRELNKTYKNSGISMPDKMRKIDITSENTQFPENTQIPENIKISENTDVCIEMGHLKVENYSPYRIRGDICDDDAQEFSDYVKRSKNAQMQFQFIDRNN